MSLPPRREDPAGRQLSKPLFEGVSFTATPMLHSPMLQSQALQSFSGSFLDDHTVITGGGVYGGRDASLIQATRAVER